MVDRERGIPYLRIGLSIVILLIRNYAIGNKFSYRKKIEDTER